MNLTIEFRSSCSSFFLVDMERYPSDTSMYFTGAIALSDAVSKFFSFSRYGRIDSTSNISSDSSNPYMLKIFCSFVSFSTRSFRRSEVHTSELQSQFHLVCRL